MRPLKLCVPAQGVCCSPHPRGAAGGTCGLWEGIGTRGWSPQDAVGAHMTEVPGLFGGVGPLQHRLWEELPHLPESTEPFSAQLKTLPWSTCHSSSERELPAPGVCVLVAQEAHATPFPHTLCQGLPPEPGASCGPAHPTWLASFRVRSVGTRQAVTSLPGGPQWRGLLSCVPGSYGVPSHPCEACISFGQLLQDTKEEGARLPTSHVHRNPRAHLLHLEAGRTASHLSRRAHSAQAPVSTRPTAPQAAAAPSS